ncbi:hypothetical protein SAMN04515647_2265 [Cohaesibacter sp. ES.047]|nr:hypothetical protein SAMN04515647_2265 [Cohaesibacter sp. ES.047]
MTTGENRFVRKSAFLVADRSEQDRAKSKSSDWLQQETSIEMRRSLCPVTLTSQERESPRFAVLLYGIHVHALMAARSDPQSCGRSQAP